MYPASITKFPPPFVLASYFAFGHIQFWGDPMGRLFSFSLHELSMKYILKKYIIYCICTCVKLTTLTN